MKAPSLELLRALRGYASDLPRLCPGRPTHSQLSAPLARRSLPRAHNRLLPGPRAFSATSRHAAAAPRSKDRGPPSKETTTTDFGALNVLGNVPPPTTAIEVCLPDGFLLDSGLSVRNGAGCILIGGEVFTWRPWEMEAQGMVNEKGQWHVDKRAWGMLELVWPKPGTPSTWLTGFSISG